MAQKPQESVSRPYASSIGAVAGFSMPILMNGIRKLPPLHAPWQHLAFAIVGSFAVKALYDWEARLILQNERSYDALKQGVDLQTARTDKFREEYQKMRQDQITAVGEKAKAQPPSSHH